MSDPKARSYQKWRSRTFWLTVAWMSFVPLSVVAAIILTPRGIAIPLGGIVWTAGVITGLFMGGEKAVKLFLAKNNGLN